MGSGFDCFDTLAYTLDPRVQGEQLRNRVRLLKDVVQQGFATYRLRMVALHLQAGAYPNTYFDFPVDRSSVS